MHEFDMYKFISRVHNPELTNCYTKWGTLSFLGDEQSPGGWKPPTIRPCTRRKV